MRSSLLGKRLVIPTLIVILSSGCDVWSRRVKVGEEFTLRPKEKVVVSGSGLGIQLETVGHSWFVDQRAHSVFASLTITGAGAPLRSSLDVGDSKTVGNYDITLKSVKEYRSDSGPKCDLVVTRRR